MGPTDTTYCTIRPYILMCHFRIKLSCNSLNTGSSGNITLSIPEKNILRNFALAFFLVFFCVFFFVFFFWGEKNLWNINGIQFLSPLPVTLLQSEGQMRFPLIAQSRKEFVWNLCTQITSTEILCFMRMSPAILHMHSIKMQNNVETSAKTVT